MTVNSYSERRNRRGILMQLINVMVALSFFSILILAVLFLLPQSVESYFNRFLIPAGAFWAKPFLCYLIYTLLLLQVGVSVVGLLMNSYRLKRKNDKYRYSLIIYALISLIVIAFYLVFV